ncbi:MAG: aldehyde dehydrogenase family protein, partial [Microbacteriaceae bacterium]
MTTVSIAGVEIDTRHYIGGQRVASATTYTNTSPIDGTFLGEISRGGAEEIDAAVSAARGAFPAWAALGAAGRGALLHKLADLIEANNEALSQLETMDNGSLLRSHRRGVMPRVAMNIRFFADWAINELHHEPFETRGHTNNVSWDPSGVAALITP